MQEIALLVSVVAGIAIPLMLQTFFLARWAIMLSARVASLEKAQARQDAHERAEKPLSRLIKLETYIELIQRQQDEQSLKLDKVLQALGAKGQ